MNIVNNNFTNSYTHTGVFSWRAGYFQWFVLVHLVLIAVVLVYGFCVYEKRRLRKQQDGCEGASGLVTVVGETAE